MKKLRRFIFLLILSPVIFLGVICGFLAMGFLAGLLLSKDCAK